jgi:putative inorganic carbon (HCO3(-)) transporter
MQRMIATLHARAMAVVEQLGPQRLLAIAILLVLIASPWAPLSLLALVAYAVVAFRDPGLTVALLPLATPFAYQPKHFFRPEFPVVELLLVLALATSTLHLLLRWRREARAGTGTATLLDTWDATRRFLSGPFGLPALALGLLGAFSLLTIVDPNHLRESIREYRTVVIEPVIYFFLARAWLREQTLRRIAIWAFVGGALIVSLLAIGQVATGRGVVAVEGVRRALGTYDHPNALALFLLRAGTFIAAFLALGPSPRRVRAGWLPPLVIVVAIFLTFSRGALVGLAIAIILVGIVLGLRRAAPALLAAAIIVVALLALAGAGLTILREGGDSLGLRQMIWLSTLAMIRDNPVFGVGLDQFYYQYAPRYVNPAAWGERFTSHPHNLFLDFWTRLGIMGFAWLVWTLGTLVAVAARGWRAKNGEGRRLLFAATIAAAAALVHGLVDNFYFLIDLAFLWWFLLALIAIATEEIDAEQAQSADEEQPTGRTRRRSATRREQARARLLAE